MVSRFSGGGLRRGLLRAALVPALLYLCLFSSCTRRLGYGILLWAVTDPPIPSGTVLPVYIRSNIDQVWVAGIPKEYRGAETRIDKFEIPLAKLELVGSKKKASLRAEELAPYALSYAETLQDGLPIRESPDNNARRSYRLKQGEIIKILSPARGQAAIGAAGDPLPGEWFRVLTEDGTIGYCFSYRLKVFEYTGGALESSTRETTEDPELDRVLSSVWAAEAYGSMVNSRRLELGELSMHWGFDPGQDTGIAVIKTEEVERSFSYTAIRPAGTRSWRFEGAPLQMNLRSDTTLAVQFTENGGILRTLLFVILPSTVDDLIVQETARQEELFNIILNQGPAYTSHNYGTITFSEGGRFNWTGFELLIPQVIPETAIGNGLVDMQLFLNPALSDRYAGAFTMRFGGVNSSVTEVDFMYSLDSQGFRLEYIPDTSRDGIVVNRRSSSPLVLYFFRAEPAPQYTDPFSFTPSDAFPSGNPGGLSPDFPPSFDGDTMFPGYETEYGAEDGVPEVPSGAAPPPGQQQQQTESEPGAQTESLEETGILDLPQEIQPESGAEDGDTQEPLPGETPAAPLPSTGDDS